MALSNMSHEGYTLRIDKTIHQSNGFNFGKITEIDVEVMVCGRCSKDCRTANLLSPKSNDENYYHEAIYGICLDCNMEYFKK